MTLTSKVCLFPGAPPPYPFVMAMQRIQRWTIEELVALVPGSTRERWEIDYLPMLISVGTLTVDGNQWLGRCQEIERSLLGATQETSIATSRQDAELHRWLRWLHVLAANATYPNAAIALATGTMSWALQLITAVPLLVLGAGLLAGSLARPLERRWR